MGKNPWEFSDEFKTELKKDVEISKENEFNELEKIFKKHNYIGAKKGGERRPSCNCKLCVRFRNLNKKE